MPMPRAAAPHPVTRPSTAVARLVVAAAAALACAAALAGDFSFDPAIKKVRVDTNLGSFTILLERERAPLTTVNFLNYVRSGQYTGTIFHRVISNFIMQGGGYDQKFELLAVNGPVANESGNGLSNKRGTVGIARTDSAHSANAQFYVNLADNDDLDPTPLRWGYAVFGRIVEGMDVVDRIGRTPTGSVGPWPKDSPLDAVIVKHMEMISDSPVAAAPVAAPPPPPPAK